MSAPKTARMLIRNPTRSAEIGMDVWWAPDRSGYTTDIAKAGAYSRDEAVDITRSSSASAAEAVPVTKDIVDSMAASIEKAKSDADARLRQALDEYTDRMKACWQLEQKLAPIAKEVTGHG